MNWTNREKELAERGYRLFRENTELRKDKEQLSFIVAAQSWLCLILGALLLVAVVLR